MINVKPTAQHISNIKRHKKFLEKWKMWEFAYYDGQDYYFVVHYTQITGKIAGYLILNGDGEELTLEKVKSPAYFLMRYNTMVHNTISQMAPQMVKNMQPFELQLDLLRKHQNAVLQARPDLSQSINKIINYTAQSLKQPQAIKDIVYTLGGYQRQVTREKGYFDQAFLEMMIDECGKYDEIMYKYGLRERELFSDYQLLYHSLEEGVNTVPLSDQKNLMKLLEGAMDSNKSTLEKSLESYEKDDYGNKRLIDPNNIKESIAKNRLETGEKDFYKEIVPYLRNKS